MSRTGGLVGAILVALLIGCGGNPEPPIEPQISAEAQLLESGIKGGLTNLLGCCVGLDKVLQAARQPAQAGALGVHYNEVPGEANTWDFLYALDLDRDSTIDAELGGRITFSSDPTDGIDPGSTATVIWDLTDLGAGVSGSGTLDLTFPGDGTVEVIGAGTFAETGGDDRFDFTILSGSPLSVLLPGLSGIPQLAWSDDEGGLAMTGTVDIGLKKGDDNASANVVLTQGTNQVQVQNALLNGIPVANFAFNWAPFVIQAIPSGWVTFVLKEHGVAGVNVVRAHVSHYSNDPVDECTLVIYNLDKTVEYEGALWGQGSLEGGGHIGWHQWLVSPVGTPICYESFEARFEGLGRMITLEGEYTTRPDPGNAWSGPPVASGFWGYEESATPDAGTFVYYDHWHDE